MPWRAWPLLLAVLVAFFLYLLLTGRLGEFWDCLVARSSTAFP